MQQQLGAPSYHWHVHGVGNWGLTYVPQGLSFISDWGPRDAVKYQLHAPDGDGELGKEHDLDLPPLTVLAHLDYAKLQRQGREEFVNELLSQREQMDDAPTNGKRSPDGRFVVGHVNLGGLANTEEVVIQERGKPERRYGAPHFKYDKDYYWLNARTIVFKVLTVGQEFYTIDALTGAMKLAVAVGVPYEPASPDSPNRVADFGVSGPHRFWYKTGDGETHEVTVPNVKAKAKG